MPSIEAFAEIGEFIARPVKEYSSGMYVRLAFATAIHVDPEILIVDEALAVGDAVFANRCVRKFEELRERKITVLFVSHDLGLVKQLSNRAILLLNGRMEAQGAPSDVINRYIGLVLEKQQATPGEAAALRGQLPPRRWRQRNPGSRFAERRRPAGDVGDRRRDRHRARTQPLSSSGLRSHGRHPHPQSHRHGCLRNQHAHREEAPGQLPAGRRAGGGFPLRLLAHAAAVHPDRRHPKPRRLQPRLAGRRDPVRRGGYARGGGSGESAGGDRNGAYHGEGASARQADAHRRPLGRRVEAGPGRAARGWQGQPGLRPILRGPGRRAAIARADRVRLVKPDQSN